MFALYKKSQGDGKAAYQFVEKASLFGFHKGYIPWLLKFQVPTGQGEPFEWHLDIETALTQRDDVNGNALISPTTKLMFSSAKLLRLGDILTMVGLP